MDQIAREKMKKLMLEKTDIDFFFGGEREIRRLIASPDRHSTPMEVMDDISNMYLMGGEL